MLYTYSNSYIVKVSDKILHLKLNKHDILLLQNFLSYNFRYKNLFTNKSLQLQIILFL